MSNTISYYHGVNSGDLIQSLPSIKHIYETTGKKGVIIQRLNVPAEYQYGAVHPVVDSNGVMVTMNEKQWSMLVPLIESQEYIDHCEVFNGQKYDVDLNKCREGYYTTLPFGVISRWVSYCDPALQCDITKSWVYVDSFITDDKPKIIVNFSERYRNPHITYFFLKKYEDRILFVGTDKEYNLFKTQNELNIDHLLVSNFHELARHIKSSLFFLGNQSMCWNIAEAMGVPRILEVCREASNCIPLTGNGNGNDFLHQGALEFFVERHMGEIPKLAIS